MVFAAGLFIGLTVGFITGHAIGHRKAEITEVDRAKKRHLDRARDKVRAKNQLAQTEGN